MKIQKFNEQNLILEVKIPDQSEIYLHFVPDNLKHYEVWFDDLLKLTTEFTTNVLWGVFTSTHKG